MMAHSRDTVVPPSMVRPGVPEDLELVVLRCLAKKPGERYQDAKALARALAECASASEWDAEKSDAWWATQFNPAPSSPSPTAVKLA